MSSLKTLFPGYFQKSSQKIQEIWNTSFLVFDTNIIFNLYRYSESTRSELLDIMEKFQDRLWLPNQVAFEYLNNRHAVINEQAKQYSETSKMIQTLEDNLNNKRNHPFITENGLRALKRVLVRVRSELNESESELSGLTKKDKILEKITELTEGKIGRDFQKDEYDKIFSDGLSRYQDKIPPGYEDEAKGGKQPNFSGKREKFGDFIIWKQLIAEAKNRESDVIFVTDDVKEDWWLILSGKTVGVRPELTAEFESQTGKEILMYNGFSFIKYAQEHLNIKISKSSLSEIQEQSRSNLENVLESNNRVDRISASLRARSALQMGYAEELSRLIKSGIKPNEKLANIVKAINLPSNEEYETLSKISNWVNQGQSREILMLEQALAQNRALISAMNEKLLSNENSFSEDGKLEKFDNSNND